MVGVIASRHHPVLGILGEFRKIVVRLRSRRERRWYRDERAGSEQACKPKFSHVSPPVFEARVSSSRDGHIAMPPSATATVGIDFHRQRVTTAARHNGARLSASPVFENDRSP